MISCSIFTNNAGNSHGEGEVAYLQSQNDNLRQDDSEFVGIRNDIPLDIPWATEALGKYHHSVD